MVHDRAHAVKCFVNETKEYGMAKVDSAVSKERRSIAELLTVQQAADLMAISRVTVWRLMERGEIGYVRISQKCRRLSLAAIEEYVERSGQPPAA
jgi:excisionase family DNA binding protein